MGTHMKTFTKKISAPRLLFGLVHCLGIALLGFYLFDDEDHRGMRRGMGLRMMTPVRQRRH